MKDTAMSRNRFLDEYQGVGAAGAIAGADAHGLIALMLSGAIERAALARSHIGRGDIAAKAREINAALAIVDGLRMGIDRGRGGEIAANLERLYEWSAEHLVLANAGNDTKALDDVIRVLDDLRGGWNDIPVAMRGNAAAAA
jgi:flagellar secretion chaperone FliS